jgi:hypothetical protein
MIVVLVGAVKIYVSAVEALRKRGKQDETQFCEFQTPTPAFYANVLFLQVFFESHSMYDQTQGSGAVFSLLYR